jgi:hypothetical protein
MQPDAPHKADANAQRYFRRSQTLFLVGWVCVLGAVLLARQPLAGILLLVAAPLLVYGGVIPLFNIGGAADDYAAQHRRLLRWWYRDRPPIKSYGRWFGFVMVVLGVGYALGGLLWLFAPVVHP